MAKELTFWRADDAQQIADGLIPSFHEHLVGIAIVYVFRSKASQHGGKDVWARTRKVSGLNAWLACREKLDPKEPSAPSFFVIEIASDIWATLTAPRRIALIDHELSHIASDLTLVGHDVEEFSAIAMRHGAWTKSLKTFKQASGQKPMFDGAEES